jgi:protein NirF
VWVNFAFPDNGAVQVIDTETQRVVRTIEAGKAIMHMEFTPRGDAVWISARDDDRVAVYDTATFARVAALSVPGPSGIFFTSRAARVGF